MNRILKQPFTLWLFRWKENLWWCLLRNEKQEKRWWCLLMNEKQEKRKALPSIECYSK
jgi:hypothetical protein